MKNILFCVVHLVFFWGFQAFAKQQMPVSRSSSHWHIPSPLCSGKTLETCIHSALWSLLLTPPTDDLIKWWHADWTAYKRGVTSQSKSHLTLTELSRSFTWNRKFQSFRCFYAKATDKCMRTDGNRLEFCQSDPLRAFLLSCSSWEWHVDESFLTLQNSSVHSTEKTLSSLPAFITAAHLVLDSLLRQLWKV